ncbi:cysteine proteinase [Rhizoclosmatium globosum]|uniref:ubiquitinyl hydrolase 1 n=1 Tax=Rhizoclosmatium globosum TaxID=329046 RepID=A0A1Y2CHN4_9FUNG|nr:cysteine proteinase [Rhizoclosmatium globosum]|eukprot:ORY46553.1 cysteine proteinase [Rhizoclosmatium globosum]
MTHHLRKIQFGSLQQHEVEQVLDVRKGWDSSHAVVGYAEPQETIQIQSGAGLNGYTVEPSIPNSQPSTNNDNNSKPSEPPSPPKQKTWAELTPNSSFKYRTFNPHSNTAPSTPEKPAVIVPQKPKSWADLVKVPESATSSTKQTAGNTCFMNVILQPLLHCPPFYNLIKQLRQQIHFTFKEKTPLMEALIRFFDEFEEDTGKEKKKSKEDDSFDPDFVHAGLLKSMKTVQSRKGQQQDAEEFLGFVLDALHEELFTTEPGKSSSTESLSPTSGDDWVEVGPKHKNTVTRTTEVKESPITQIFGGKTRSESVTLEPIQRLQLDIMPDHINSINDALLNLTTQEVIHGYKAPNLGILVDATKQTFMDQFPPILILHMKRFEYNMHGLQKIRKHISFSDNLKSNLKKNNVNLQYRLFAVINHHGKTAANGHYTCDVQRQNEEWLQDVLKEMDERQAYMLFYAKS